MDDPIELFETAASHAATLVGGVRPEHRAAPTPCTEWDVDALVTHMAGGPAYLLAALGHPDAPTATDETSYRAAIATCIDALHQPGALERRCLSPLGFEWSLAEAVAGTFMDQLIHTWDLAVATGQDEQLDPRLVDVCIAMFLPAMPALGRANGLIGDEVVVTADAPAQHRLLGARGRTP